MKNKYHYVYRITNIIEKKHYYGSRSSKKIPKKDIGIYYFSSSTDKDFIKDQKINIAHYKYVVVRLFDNRKDATSFEVYLHAKFDVGNNKNFYNKAKQTAIGFIYNMSGRTQTDKQREIVSKLHLNKIVSKETIEKQKKTIKEKYENGYINPLTGRPLPEIQKWYLSFIMKEKYKNGYINPCTGTKTKQETLDKIKATRMKINDTGNTGYKDAAIKAANTMKNNINENGLSIRENANIKKVITMQTTIDENGQTLYNKSAKKGSLTKEQNINNDGLNIHQIAAKKYKERLDLIRYGENLSTRDKLKRPKLDKSNYQQESEKINIYNNLNELIYEVRINLRKFCKEHSLPYNELYKSKKENIKLYENITNIRTLTILKNKGYYKYFGWYATKL